MEAVIFDGKEYIKASVLAERFNYTQDYLGQLCRAKKVDARLVGRAWYIQLDSLQSHKKTRYKAPVSGKAVPRASLPKIESQHYLTRIDVEPVLQKKTVKILKNEAGRLNEFPVKYEKDDYSLIPKISREAIYKPLHIVPAEAEDVVVKAEKSSIQTTSFKAEPLPEVYLKGVLKVDGIPEITEETILPETTAADEQIEPNQSEKIAIVENEIPKEVAVNTKIPLKIKLYRQKEELPVMKPIPAKSVVTVSTLRPRVDVSTLQSAPTQIRKRELPVKNARSDVKTPALGAVAKKQEIVVIPHSTVKAGAIVAFGIFIALGVLLVNERLVVSGGVASVSWTLSPEKLQEAGYIFSQIRR